MRCLIVGVGGQDGSYLADLLLAEGHEVIGTHRRASVDNLTRVAHCRDRIRLHRADLTDPASVDRVLWSRPDEIYWMADQDHVDWSFACPAQSADVTYGSVVRMLESVRNIGRYGNPWSPRILIPISATVFGDAPPPQSIRTPLNPLSPYAVSKAAAWMAARYYRQVWGMKTVCPVLFNHDSPRRTNDYLLGTVCKAALSMNGDRRKVVLPFTKEALDKVVDIGHARDYCEAMIRLLRIDEPEAAISSPFPWKIRTLLDCARELLGVPMFGLNDGWDNYAAPEPTFKRPGPVHDLRGEGPVSIEHLVGDFWRYNTADLIRQIVESRF